MSESLKDKSVQPDPESGNENEIEVNRSVEEYAKRLKEVSEESKKFRQKNSELSKKLQELEDAKLKEQGKVQELYDKTKHELEQERESRKKDKASFAYRTVTAQIQQEAMKLGCLDPKALVAVSSAQGFLDEISVDEQFNVEQGSLKTFIEKTQKEMPYLFGKAAPAIKDVVPNNKGESKTGVEALSLAEKIKKLAELNNQPFIKKEF